MGNSTHLSGSSSSLSIVLPLFRDAAKQRGDKQGREMIGEEVSGPAGPKVLRLLYFVGAGFICVAAINKWRELERKSLQRQQQQLQHQQLLNAQSPHSQESPLSKPLD